MMQLDGSGFFFAALLTGIIPFLIGVVALYWIIRLGVKHGMRSYYRSDEAEGRRGPDPGR